MNIKINSVRVSPTSKLEAFVQEKVKKLGQYSDEIIGAEVFLKIENAQEMDNKVVEIRMDIPGNDLFIKKQSKTFEEATDLAVDSLKRQLTKFKEKRRGQ
ncbi:MAG: ribosome-associated translation inhibitor RaiA [Bacteroidota bacterium]|nr:MAG: ribosome-associated translation inhibitor RaiA [Bacteroidota bacterium]